MPLGVSGAALMMWSLLVFPRVIKGLGARACALLGLYVSALVPVVLGSISFLGKAGMGHMGIIVALVIVEIFKACFQQLCFPTSMVRLQPMHTASDWMLPPAKCSEKCCRCNGKSMSSEGTLELRLVGVLVISS
jgi:hypothetical protein